MMEVLKHTAHRPWPLPRGPWIMQQVWHDLLFAHWPVPVADLRPRIPPQLEIDTFAGQAWVGVVPFRMSGVRMRGTPGIPRFSSFPELNVRTYVVRDNKPGVWFFSLDAANALAVWGARLAFHLPYFRASMRCEEVADWIQYLSTRQHAGAPPASLRALYRGVGETSAATPGTLDYFLTERYCLYTVNRKESIIRCDIHHPAWSLQRAEASFRENTIASAAGISLADKPPHLLHFAKRQDVLVWSPQRLKR
jgi:uncharacterized protein YqjF (DUF2071 family)